jgi:predicted  nucleic acid-binding Zn-ribbon protein
MEERLQEKAKKIQEEIKDFREELSEMSGMTYQIEIKIRELIKSWENIGEDVMELELKIHEAKKLMQKLSKEE